MIEAGAPVPKKILVAGLGVRRLPQWVNFPPHWGSGITSGIECRADEKSQEADIRAITSGAENILAVADGTLGGEKLAKLNIRGFFVSMDSHFPNR